MPTLSETLAHYALTADAARIAEPVRHEARRALLNWVGCALGGSASEAVSRCAEGVALMGAAGSCTVIGRAERFDAPRAAFVNTFSSSVHAFDDTHLTSIAHPTGPVGAACLAIAERNTGIAGPKFLHALTMGLEVECRMAAYLAQAPAECSVGWTMTGLVGGVGAATAVGVLLGLSERELVSAFGIAATRAGGLRSAGFGYMGRDLPMGYAAQAGVESALLAKAGFTAAPQALDAPTGLGAMFSRNADPKAATDGLGSRYEFMTNAFKPYPAGIVGHPAIDACMSLAVEHAIRPETIERIDLRVHIDAIRLMGDPDPRDMYAAQVSTPHWAAVSLARRKAGLAEASTEAANDPAVKALRARVHLVADPALGRDAAIATVTLKNGQSLAKNIVHCLGSRHRPMSDAELEAKFRGQAQGVMDNAAIGRLMQFCWGVEGESDVAAGFQRAMANSI